jgi:hypothetical protein
MLQKMPAAHSRSMFMGLVLVAACALSGTMASSSMAARCYIVAEPNSGNRSDTQCTNVFAGGEFIKINRIVVNLTNGVWCAETEEANKGNWTVPQCSPQKAMGMGNYIKVYERPHWRVGGDILPQGIAKQIKLQLKGTAALTAKIAGAEVRIDCKNSVSEASGVEDTEVGYGQGKGRFAFTQCEVPKPASCSVAEPLTTVQTKSHLGTYMGAQTKHVDLFEPQQGTTLATVKFKGSGCGVLLGSQPLKGSIAAEVLPAEAESQEILLNFPEKPITELLLEYKSVKPTLSLGGEPAVFSGAYGARLETGEAFGAIGG